MTEPKLSMTVTLDGLTRPQAIALEAMFDRWRELGSIGSSRMVGFYVDGDGNFRPKPQITFSEDPYPADADHDALKAKAVCGIPNTCAPDNCFDFDPVAWAVRTP